MRPNNTDLANRPVLTPEQQEDLSQQLVKAVRTNKIEEVNSLIEAGADVNKYDRNHLTPFLVAFFKLNNSDLLKAVIKGILDGDNVGNLEFLSKQLEGEQIRNIIIDNSSKSDVKKLAVFASEEIQDLIVDHFNEKNLGNHIDTGEGSKVAILRELKSDYLTPSAENVSSSEKKVSIPRLGNIAFNQILKSPEDHMLKLEDSEEVSIEEQSNTQPNPSPQIQQDQTPTQPLEQNQSPTTVGRGGNVGCSIS